MNKKVSLAILLIIVVAGLAVLARIVFTPSPGSPEKREGYEKSLPERNFVALGASITKANNLSSKMVGDHPEYSFSTGTEIDSVYLYLKNRGENLNAINLAESGAASKDILAKQVPRAVELHPRYITLGVGADVLDGTSIEQFRRNLEEIISKIKTGDVTVLVGSYPNLFYLRRAAYSSCTQDKLGLGIGRLTEEKLKSFNQVIREIVEENGLIFVDIYDVLEPEDVSDYDCIHPNIEGQRKLAQEWIQVLEVQRR